jgi:hypothetical protein
MKIQALFNQFLLTFISSFVSSRLTSPRAALSERCPEVIYKNFVPPVVNRLLGFVVIGIFMFTSIMFSRGRTRLEIRILPDMARWDEWRTTSKN